MARDLEAAFQTETLAASLVPVFFAEMVWSGSTVRLWTGIGDITWGGNTWNGVGTFASLSEIRETADLYAAGFVLGLSGIPSDIVSKVYTEKHRGRAVTVYMGALNKSTLALVADPDVIQSGFMESVSDTDDGQTASVSVRCESEGFHANQLRERRYTEHDQKQLHGDDWAMRHIAESFTKASDWGTKGY